MGRLDNIVARNRRPHWSRNPVVHAIAVVVLLIIVLVLVAFTDLAQPGGAGSSGAAHPGSNARPSGEVHVDGVLLRRLPAAGSGRAHRAPAGGGDHTSTGSGAGAVAPR